MTSKLYTWPQRPLILSVFLAIAGLVFYLIVEEKVYAAQNLQLRIALATFIAVAAMSFAFALERLRWQWVVGFSLVWGAVLAIVAYSSFTSQTRNLDFSWSLSSGLIAVGIALPLFQTILKHGRLTLTYKDLHQYAWGDALCWCASWAFVGLSFGLAHLLASLFDLIGIDFLKQLLKKDWFIWMFIGASLGAALGVIKENERIVASLQSLVMAILSILTPVLAISLILFLVALPFTGLQAFWDTTTATTPILLSCAIGAITLVNAIIRNCSDDESKNRLMRYSAVALSVCILPLASISFISMQLRIEQHGLTPDRIWGLIAVLVALAYGIAYLWSLVKSRENWTSNIRLNNTRMAVLLCLTSLFLALPILNFAQMSVDSQLARIAQGTIKADKIDYAAFAFNFGESGRKALQEMQSSTDDRLANAATVALAADNRWELQDQLDEAKSASIILTKLTVFPQPVSIPQDLQKLINKQAGCLGEYCLLIWQQGSEVARFISSECTSYYDRDANEYSRASGFQHCPPVMTLMNKIAGKWELKDHYNYDNPGSTEAQKEQDRLSIANAIKQGDIEVRTVERKQIFIGGKPVGRVY